LTRQIFRLSVRAGEEGISALPGAENTVRRNAHPDANSERDRQQRESFMRELAGRVHNKLSCNPTATQKPFSDVSPPGKRDAL
jgi:hypothetical protein